MHDGVEPLRGGAPLPPLRRIECEYEPAWQPEDMSEGARVALGF